MKLFIKLISFVYFVFMLYAVLVLLLTYAPRVVGIIPLEVETNALEEKYPVGSLAFVQKTDVENFVSGDVVVYTDINSQVIFNTVYDSDLVNRTLIANGTDSAQLTPATVSQDYIIGKAVFKIPYIGSAFSLTAKKDMSIPILIEVIVAMVIFSFVIGKLKSVAWDNV